MALKKNTLICLLDKPYPPDHSFVTGMLAQALPRDGDVRVELLVMAPLSGPISPTRYHRAVCLPMVPDFTRSGRSRLRAMLAARRLAIVLINKARRRGENVVLFVRNHPMLMLVGASLRHRADGLLFQSSYPLEREQKSRVRRLFHTLMLRMGGRRVDGVLAVSPLGLERAQALCSEKAAGLVVPLLSDLPRASAAEEGIWGDVAGPARFIYAGTHQPQRRLDVVLEGIVAALDDGTDAEFVFVGGKPPEVDALRQPLGVKRWENAGRIRFLDAVPRPRIAKLLQGADVGLSLVPETSIYREASPTKLAEYMGAGLAVLANRGIELQERFVQDANCGILVDFDSNAIARGISEIAKNHDLRIGYQKNAEQYARNELCYSRYVPAFVNMIELREQGRQ